MGSTTQRRGPQPVSALAVHGVPGTRAPERPADGLLDGGVGVGDRRQVGLGRDVQVERLEAAHGDRVGVVGQQVGESQVVGQPPVGRRL
jgi:hypothetical protein